MFVLVTLFRYDKYTSELLEEFCTFSDYLSDSCIVTMIKVSFYISCTKEILCFAG